MENNRSRIQAWLEAARPKTFGKEGMVHISKIAKERIEHVEDVLTLGDKVRCKCMGKDKMGRLSFSIKDAE